MCGAYWLERHSNAIYYVAWYDPATEQTRRRTLRTRIEADAVRIFDGLASEATGGDPRPLGDPIRISTVAELMQWFAATRGRQLASRDHVTAAVRLVSAHFGNRSVTCLGPDAIDRLEGELRQKGHSTGYISRTLGVLRSAVHRAHDRRLIPERYAIPSPERKSDRDAAPLRGRRMAPAEIARLVDATPSRHLVDFIRLGLATVGRRGALLDLTREQVDFGYAIIALNPPGRVQTKKFRPVVVAIPAIRDWLAARPAGPLVTTERAPGKALKSVRTAWRAACGRAGFGPDVTAYSLRHSAAGHMRRKGVPSEQISIQLGHVPVDVKAVTLRYSPYDPDYLAQAAAAIADFYAAVDALVTNPLWRA